MPVDPRLLDQVLRRPRDVDVRDTPIVRTIILRDPANAEILVPFLDDPRSTAAVHARRILCLFDRLAVPPLMKALGDTRRTADGRVEGLGALWSMLLGEQSFTVRDTIRQVTADVRALLADKRPIPDRMPAVVERDFHGRVCDLTCIVLGHLTDREFNPSRFRGFDDEERDREIGRFERRLFGGIV